MKKKLKKLSKGNLRGIWKEIHMQICKEIFKKFKYQNSLISESKLRASMFFMFRDENRT